MATKQEIFERRSNIVMNIANSKDSRAALQKRIDNLVKDLLEATKESDLRGIEVTKLAKAIDLSKDQLPEFFKNMVKPTIEQYDKRCTKRKS